MSQSVEKMKATIVKKGRHEVGKAPKYLELGLLRSDDLDQPHHSTLIGMCLAVGFIELPKSENAIRIGENPEIRRRTKKETRSMIAGTIGRREIENLIEETAIATETSTENGLETEIEREEEAGQEVLSDVTGRIEETTEITDETETETIVEMIGIVTEFETIEETATKTVTETMIDVTETEIGIGNEIEIESGTVTLTGTNLEESETDAIDSLPQPIRRGLNAF